MKHSHGARYEIFAWFCHAFFKRCLAFAPNWPTDPRLMRPLYEFCLEQLYWMDANTVGIAKHVLFPVMHTLEFSSQREQRIACLVDLWKFTARAVRCPIVPLVSALDAANKVVYSTPLPREHALDLSSTMESYVNLTDEAHVYWLRVVEKIMAFPSLVFQHDEAVKDPCTFSVRQPLWSIRPNIASVADFAIPSEPIVRRALQFATHGVNDMELTEIATHVYDAVRTRSAMPFPCPAVLLEEHVLSWTQNNRLAVFDNVLRTYQDIARIYHACNVIPSLDSLRNKAVSNDALAHLRKVAL